MSVDIPTGASDLGDGVSAEVFEAVSAAERVLSHRFGATITLGAPEDLGGGGRATVIRVRVVSTPFSLPRTLVVKRYPKPRSGSEAERLAREAVSYQLFTALASEDRMCPELFAHGAPERILVLEDLGPASTLADQLLGHDSKAAERALLSWARSLGRLHATTAGREADFDALMRRQELPRERQPLSMKVMRSPGEMSPLLQDTLGIQVGDLAVIVTDRIRWLTERGRHRAFSPSDLCPDNNLITAKGVRFLDFEEGCVREALLDVGYLLVPFPLCPCGYALPPGMTEAMVAAWKAEVKVVWPDLNVEDRLASQLLDVRIFWVWLSTWRFLPRRGEQDRPIDRSTLSPMRGVLLAAQWAQLATEAERLGVAAVADPANAVAAALAERFGAALDLFPAFR